MSKYVCSRCFDDPHIRDFIEWNAVSEECSFCEGKTGAPIAAELSEVAKFILEKIETEYDDATNWLPWESAEGGWQGTTYDTGELLCEIIGLNFDAEDLLNDLVDSLPDYQWCDRNPFGKYDLDLNSEWERFSYQTKHEVRHVFFRLPTSASADTAPEISPLWRSSQPYEVLYKIGELVNRLNLVRSYAQGQTFFRARLHRKTRYITVNQLGPPPSQQARYSNRFSPAGIPMFYGALDEDTTIAEIYDTDKKQRRIASIGVFENIVPLRILDLTNLPPRPSIFDDLSVSERDPLRFLHEFVRKSTKSIRKDGREHVDYVPTQVVTEYFRHIFKTDDGNCLHGILYPSATGTGGVCCVLFVTSAACTEDKRPIQAFLGYREAILSLITSATSYRELP